MCWFPPKFYVRLLGLVKPPFSLEITTVSRLTHLTIRFVKSRPRLYHDVAVDLFARSSHQPPSGNIGAGIIRLISDRVTCHFYPISIAVHMSAMSSVCQCNPTSLFVCKIIKVFQSVSYRIFYITLAYYPSPSFWTCPDRTASRGPKHT